MSIVDKVEENEKKIHAIEEQINKKKNIGWKFRIPKKLLRIVDNDSSKVIALWISPNRSAEFKTAFARSGLWYIDDKTIKTTGQRDAYAYEEKAIFQLKIKKKRYPIIILFSWRLLPGGGDAEEYEALILGGKTSEEALKQTGIHKHGQLTIVRQIEQAELDKDGIKKKMSMSWIIWVLVIGAIIYLISRIWG